VDEHASAPPRPSGKTSPPETVVATTTFGTQHGVVHGGDKFAGDDPLVLANPSWFADADTPTSELPNIWRDMPPPPEQVASPGFNVQVQSIQIPRIGRSSRRSSSGRRRSGHRDRLGPSVESRLRLGPLSAWGRSWTFSIRGSGHIRSGSSSPSVT
jgi:hypothetical protein